jgi:hypothetical protein
MAHRISFRFSSVQKKQAELFYGDIADSEKRLLPTAMELAQQIESSRLNVLNVGQETDRHLQTFRRYMRYNLPNESRYSCRLYQ